MADARIVTDSHSPLSPDAKPPVSRGARACTVCRTAKMKCVGAEDDGAKPCQRCRRSNLDCVFEKHRRGRKPGSKLSEASKMLRKLEKGLGAQKVKLQDPSELSPQHPFPVSDSRSAPAPTHQFHSRYSPRDICVPAQSPRDYPQQPPPHPQFPTLTAPYTARYQDPPQPLPPAAAPAAHRAPSSASLTHSIDPDDEEDPDKDIDETMYPAKMVEREGRRHSFFGVVLDNPDASKAPPQKPHSPSQPSAHYSNSNQFSIPRHPPLPIVEDPVTAGLIPESEVTWLFKMVLENLNPLINLFDPALHTPQYVRSRSPFLFTTLLMAGCKFWKPDRFKACQRLAEEFTVRAFQENHGAIEVVQAFACMTYWKEPDDRRTWTYIGYACRMAIDIGLNRFCPKPPPNESEHQRLERRNKERTYLVLWVHDRSLNVMTGRQWMLPEDDLVRNSAKWHEGSSLPLVDVVISALVALRRIAAEITDGLYLHKGASGTVRPDVHYEILLHGCNGRLDVWSTTWNEHLDKVNAGQFHYSFLQFFRLHVRLFLNSFGLHSTFMSSPGGDPSVTSLSICFKSAWDTLELVTKKFQHVDMLRYGQDSITVMTAYSAIFLLKLLDMNPKEVGGPTRTKEVYELVIAAADGYQDAAKGMPSCASVDYHGRFLRTLIMYREWVERERGAQTNGTGASAHPAASEQTAQGQSWNFPASPHLPTHPLVLEQIATFNNGAGQSQSAEQAPVASVVTPVEDAAAPYGPTQKDLAYWYTVHAGFSGWYGMGVNPFMGQQDEQQQQQQPQAAYSVYGTAPPA